MTEFEMRSMSRLNKAKTGPKARDQVVEVSEVKLVIYLLIPN